MKRERANLQIVEFSGNVYLVLIARRDIEEGEELLYDYGDRAPATITENPWLVNS